MSDQRTSDFQIARFNLVCSNLPWLLLGILAMAVLMVSALEGELSGLLLVCWFVSVSLILIVRLLLLRAWSKTPTTTGNVRRRIQHATMLSTLTAICFGVIGYLGATCDNQLVSVYVVMQLTVMVAVSTAAISHLLPMYLLYVVPLLVPVAIKLYGFDEQVYRLLSGSIAVYLLVCLGVSRSIRASLLHSINLRYDNVELLENLQREKQRAEVALEREEQANHAKSRFLAAASHDLRQPLHSLRLFTTTLALQTGDSKHKTLVSQIDSSVKSLEELFNALLDISKLDAGTISVDKQHVHLDLLLLQIQNQLTPLAQQKGLTIDFNLSRHVVHTDALLLERLITNLASNAIRYTDNGGVTISTEEDVAAKRIWITVADTGVGIPADDQTRIFEEFIQLDNAERDRNQGIGLGLSIVKRLCDLLDVDIEVLSEPGKGSSFRAGVPAGDQSQSVLPSRVASDANDHVGSLFVLVVDDEEEVCLAVEGLLETWGCIVMTATSGAAALQQLREIGEVPDVLVTDYRLRDGETGGDVVSRIRQELDHEVPAIVLTGDIAPERLIEINALGLPTLHKPCEPGDLRNLLARETRPTQVLNGVT